MSRRGRWLLVLAFAIAAALLLLPLWLGLDGVLVRRK